MLNTFQSENSNVTVFDFSSDRLVLAGTAYGEARGCGQSCMQDVVQAVLNRVTGGWPGGSIVGVCLAPKQFSCWNASDPNRVQILAAAKAYTPLWQSALALADIAIAGSNPDRLLGADSYFAKSMQRSPYWAAAPAVWRFSDSCHSFWRVHPGPPAPHVSVPVVSAHAPLTATDQLNQDQLDGMEDPAA
jgi:spore germination cell wall hydrolase CwlJ-like protein